MHAHIVMIVAGLALAAPATADPVEVPAQKTDQQTEPPVVLIAAAADLPQVKAQQQQQDAAPAARPVRHARVTSCRCGDQNPSE